jgi:hypothetical protein
MADFTNKVDRLYSLLEVVAVGDGSPEYFEVLFFFIDFLDDFFV